MGVNTVGSDAFGGTLTAWTEITSGGFTSGWSISGGYVKYSATGSNKAGCLLHNTECTDATQWAKVKIVTIGVYGAPAIVLRYNNTSSYYAVEPGGDGKVYWWGPTYADEIANSPLSFANGDSIGVTVTGTGNATTVRVWKNPTGNSPDSVSLWGGASPGVTFTNDPSTGADGGKKCGVAGFMNETNYFQGDDWYFGDITADAAGNPMYYYAQMAQSIKDKWRDLIRIPGFDQIMAFQRSLKGAR